MAFTITANDTKAKAKIAALEAAMTPAATDPVVQKVAWKTHRALVMKTPKGFTGQTRRDWHVYKRTNAGGGYLVTNQSKVMFFLERGTKAHGPKTKKMLFIPLNRKAAIGGWNSGLTIGVDYILRKKVKGIKKMLIVAKQRPKTAEWLLHAMKVHIQKALTS